MRIEQLKWILPLAMLAVCSVAEAQLTHYWSFNSDFSDQVGTANGTAVGSGTSISALDFQAGGGALRIAHDTAGGDYVDITQAVIPTTNPNAFSISAWYRYEDLGAQATDGRNFIWETVPSFTTGVGLGTAGDTEWFFDGTSSNPSDTTGPTGDDGTWHHVLKTWNKPGDQIQFFHDGVRLNSQTIGGNDLAGQPTTGFHIGNHRAGDGTRNFDGFIDEVAVYGTALTVSEAQTIAFAGANGRALNDATSATSQFTADVVPTAVDFGGTAAAPQWAIDSFSPVAGADNDLGDGGFSGAYFRTQGAGDNTLTLTYSDLPTHNTVDLGMIVAQLDSLDPDRDGDRFIVNLDGQEILSVGLGYGTSVDNAFSDEVVFDVMINGQSVADSVILDTQTVSGADLFGSTNFLENMYDLGLLDAFQDIPHTSDTLTLEIIGRQNQAAGEFFGVDNISVTTAVPEPASIVVWTLLGSILVWSGCLFRRRRTASHA